MSDSTSVRPAGFFLIGAFFYFGSLMAAFAAVTLFHSGSWLDRLWALNRPAYTALAALGRIVVAPFAVLSVVLFLAGVGWFRRRYWGWLLGTTVIATNLAGDFIHSLLGDWLRSGIGIIIAGLLLFYLTRPAVRTYFLPHVHPVRPHREL
jgi:hypothetical protein